MIIKCYLPLVAFILLGVQVAHAAPGAEVKVEYDRFKGQSTVALSPDIAALDAQPQLTLFTFFKGTQPTRPDFVAMTFWSTHKDWEYLKCHSVSTLVDGAPFKLPDSKHDGTVGSGYVVERVKVTIPFDDLERMARGKSVEFRICNTEFALDDNMRGKVRQFVAVFEKADSNSPATRPSASSRAEEITRAVAILKCNFENEAKTRQEVSAQCGGYFLDGQILDLSKAEPAPTK